ncbi:MAG TPA: hypothetical protein VKA83_18795 [Methylomirabilota bacterium]|jgi:hypothetical protein|nr:hypothetical protein [Methylomirabilota bacterium]
MRPTGPPSDLRSLKVRLLPRPLVLAIVVINTIGYRWRWRVVDVGSLFVTWPSPREISSSRWVPRSAGGGWRS